MKNASMNTTQSETEEKWTYSSRGKYPKASSGNITKNLKKKESISAINTPNIMRIMKK
jgi:hypothetical protein